MNRKLTFLSCTLACLFLAGTALAHPPGGDGGPFAGGGPGEGGPKMGHGFKGQLFEGLGLSESQREQIRALHDKRTSLRDQHEDLQAKREELINEIKAQRTDESKVLTLVEQVNKLHAEINTTRVKNLLQMKKILTPEQFKILTERIDEHIREHGHRFGGGPGGPRADEGPGGPEPDEEE
jgi:Spy/CpxP family protein refolding chaperone